LTLHALPTQALNIMLIAIEKSDLHMQLEAVFTPEGSVTYITCVLLVATASVMDVVHDTIKKCFPTYLTGISSFFNISQVAPLMNRQLM